MTQDGQRVVLITGCSSGIGRALAEEFLERGDRVAVTARNTDSLAGLIGDRCLILPLDLTDGESINRAVTATALAKTRVVVSVDRHFAEIPGVDAENWASG